jgi:cystathionine beta-lyase
MHAPADPRFDAIDLPSLRRRRGAKWSKFGPDVVPAWVADMDFAPAPPVRAAILDLVERGDLGYPWLSEANPVAPVFAAWAARRYGWQVDPDRVVNAADVLQPLYFAILHHSEPGDGVVVQTPIYPPFLMSVEQSGRRLVDHPLGPASAGYPLDVDGLADLVDDGTRVVLLCNPHNPSGRVFTRAELEALAAVAVERDLVVVSDEIHGDLTYPGATHIPFATLGPEVAARTITLTSATKSFNIAGLRLAVAVFGSAALQERYQAEPRFLYGGVNSLGVAATVAAWTDGDDWLDGLVAYLDGNRREVERFVAESLPGVSHVAPEATYLAWLDARQLVADGVTDNPATFFLERARVGLNDGADFGVHGAGFLRLNFATSRSVLREVLERMAAALPS